MLQTHQDQPPMATCKCHPPLSPRDKGYLHSSQAASLLRFCLSSSWWIYNSKDAVNNRSATEAILGLTPTGIIRALSALFFKLPAGSDRLLWRNHTRCQGLTYELGGWQTKYRSCCNHIMGEQQILKILSLCALIFLCRILPLIEQFLLNTIKQH